MVVAKSPTNPRHTVCKRRARVFRSGFFILSHTAAGATHRRRKSAFERNTTHLSPSPRSARLLAMEGDRLVVDKRDRWGVLTSHIVEAREKMTAELLPPGARLCARTFSRRHLSAPAVREPCMLHLTGRRSFAPALKRRVFFSARPGRCRGATSGFRGTTCTTARTAVTTAPCRWRWSADGCFARRGHGGAKPTREKVWDPCLGSVACCIPHSVALLAAPSAALSYSRARRCRGYRLLQVLPFQEAKFIEAEPHRARIVATRALTQGSEAHSRAADDAAAASRGAWAGGEQHAAGERGSWAGRASGAAPPGGLGAARGEQRSGAGSAPAAPGGGQGAALSSHR